MFPPRGRPAPQGVNLQQLFRARQAMGLEVPPDMLRAFEETQTPAQQAEFQQRYAQQGQALPGTTPALPEGYSYDVPPAAPVQGPNGVPVYTSPEVVLPPAAPPAIPPAPAMPGRAGSEIERRSDRLRAVARDRRVYGRAPGGGDATYGDPGTQQSTRDATPDEELAAGSPERDVTGNIAAQSPEEGGTGARLGVTSLDATGLGFEVPDVGPGHVPAEFLATPNGLVDWVRAAESRFEGTATVSLEPGREAITPAMARALLSQARLAVTEEMARRSLATGTGGARLDTTVTQQVTTPGQASALVTARLVGAGMETAQARGAHDAAQLAEVAGQEAAGQTMGTAQEAAALEQERRAAEQAADMQERLATLNRRIDDVSGRRISQDEAFGGMGGRIGAAIAVALGQLGSALGGGENAALGIVNGIVDRNMRAQAANIDNERSGVQAAGNALQQMRAVLGDENAAQAGARAMHLAAIETQLRGHMAGLTGDRLASAQRLLAAVQREREAAQAYANEVAAGTTRMGLRTRVRGSEGDVRGAIARLAGLGRQQEAAAAVGVGGAPSARPAGTGQRRQTVPGAGRTRGPGTYRLAEPDIEDALENPHVDTPSGTRPLMREGQPQPGWRAAFEAGVNGTGEEAQAFRDMQAELNVWTSWVPRIVEINRRLGVELSRGDSTAATANAMATLLRQITQHRFTGAAFSEAERQQWLENLPPLGELTASNFTQWWDTFANSWLGFANAQVDYLRQRLATFGLEPDTEQLLGPEQFAVLNRGAEQAAASEQARQDARQGAGVLGTGWLADAYNSLFGE